MKVRIEDAIVDPQNIDRYSYDYSYKNVDSIVWLKYFNSIDHDIDIYRLIDFKSNPDLKIKAKISSYDNSRSKDVIFEALNNSIYGMKPLKEYKDRLSELWGRHRDNKMYKITVFIDG